MAYRRGRAPDRQGHWFELSSFRDGLYGLGDSIEILCYDQVESWLIDILEARPVLPSSI